MDENTLSLLTEDEINLHKEFLQCQNEEELERFIKKVEMLNESRENNEIPHLDMTLEEFRAKYHTISHEDLMKKYGL